MATETDGVVISQETIASSEKKKRAHRTLRQMPIYRDIANLKYFYVDGHYESIHMKNEYKLNF